MAKIYTNDYTIKDSSSLLNIRGYTSIAGNLVIRYPGCTSLYDLEYLTEIGGSLEICSCNSLTSLDGLNKLTLIGRSLNIDGNNNLDNIDSLKTLTAVGDSLWIENNKALREILQGLSNLTSVGGKSFEIRNNLSTVSLRSFHELQQLMNRIVSKPLFPNTIPIPTINQRYPHACPRCGSPAYIGFSDIDCSKGCSKE